MSNTEKRKRGRPATGSDPVVSVRLPAELVAAIDAEAAESGTSRQAVIRAVIEREIKRRGVETA